MAEDNHNFTFWGVPNRYPDVVQRMAVLYPLRGISKCDDDVRVKTQELLDQWRARLDVLAINGFLQGDVDGRVNYVKRCLPTFAIAKPITRTCKQRAICPWCYARAVTKTWKQIDDNCFAGKELLTDLPVTYHFIFRKHTFYRPVLPVGDSQHLTVPQNLAILLKGITQSRRSAVDMVKPIGGLLNTTVEPWENGTAWRIQHRQLYQVLPEYATPQLFVNNTDGALDRCVTPTRKKLVELVASVFRYPGDLLTGDPERTVQLLATRKALKFRSYAMFGNFRNKGR